MRLFKICITTLLVLICLSGGALAGDKPVSLDMSTVEDGQTDVPLDAEIVLTFTNNVVNVSVKDDNMGCIKLMCGGDEIAVDIIMADDQIEPDKKRIITVVPQGGLEKGKKYELIISGNLTAKNGNKIGEDMVITFSTQGAVSCLWYIAGAVIVVLAGVILILVRKRNGNNKEA